MCTNQQFSPAHHNSRSQVSDHPFVMSNVNQMPLPVVTIRTWQSRHKVDLTIPGYYIKLTVKSNTVPHLESELENGLR